MKVTFNWLKHFVDFDWSAEELPQKLTMLGLEVEGIERIAGDFQGIVVAQILTREKVPGSDKLSVCRVNDGTTERTIICGAENHQPGDKVPLILPDFALPLKPGEKEPFVIKERKVFGIVSQGMMCSPKELGLSNEGEGLLILGADARIGQPFAEYLGRSGGDVVYDLEITPNRPDLNSVIGIAREIAAATGNPLRMPQIRSQESANPSQEPGVTTADLVAVRIEDSELCPRYTARVIRGVKVGPSPDWLRVTLERVGIRSINNVVDVSNYVMMETGQPLHIFDYHLISPGEDSVRAGSMQHFAAVPATGKSTDCPTLVIRRAATGEAFVTLDGQLRKLTNEMLLITDEKKGIALAGVMGGQNTGVNDQTADVLIESAFFKPSNIRRTSKALGLRTDASYRFERGADIGIVDWASRRCAQLVLELAGGTLADGVVDAYPHPVESGQVTLRYAKANALLGIEIPHASQVKPLIDLGFEVVAQTSDTCTVRIPSFRLDLKRETDLIEEIERLYGLDKVPATPPRGAIGSHPFDAVYDQISEARRILTSLGLNEAQGQTLVGKSATQIIGADRIELANPLSAEMDLLRPSLLPGLLAIMRHNQSRGNRDVEFFEIGRVFQSAGDGRAKEDRCVAIAITGSRNPVFWSGSERDAKVNVYDLKGLLEEFLEQFGIRGAQYVRNPESDAMFVESSAVLLGGKLPLGKLGQLLPALAKEYDLRDPVFFAELNLDELMARRNPLKTFKPLPTFPPVRRDIAMFVPEGTGHDAILAAIKKARPTHLESVQLFDVFRGKNVPAGQKSMAYAFTYRHPDRSLTDAEVNATHEKLSAEMKQELGAAIREA